jgi:hypothetical protein
VLFRLFFTDDVAFRRKVALALVVAVAVAIMMVLVVAIRACYILALSLGLMSSKRSN